VAAACPEPVEGFGYSDGVHLRHIHYQLVSQDPPVVKPDGRPYENTTNDWAYLLQASKAARYLNLVDPAAFVDRRNPDPHIYRLYLGSSGPWVDITGDWRGDFDVTLPEFSQFPDFELYGYKPRQPYHLEIWCEKMTMNDVLLPLCRQYDVNLVTGAGELSITAALDFVKRVPIAPPASSTSPTLTQPRKWAPGASATDCGWGSWQTIRRVRPSRLPAGSRGESKFGSFWRYAKRPCLRRGR